MSAEPLLELCSVTTELEVGGAFYPAIRDVDLTVHRGEIVGLVGESGSGKSMTARTVVRLLPDRARVRGAIMFEGEDILKLGREQLRALRARRLSMIVQDPKAGMNPLHRCGHSVTEVLRASRGRSKSQADQEARRLLDEVGIDDPRRVMRSYPHELSGGMLQRVLIAGALAAEPEILIADEPTTALDVTIQAEVVRLLDKLRETRHLALLFITHDLELAAALCDRIAVMYGGQILEIRPAQQLFEHPRQPYTGALLAARPNLKTRADRLTAIPGQPPDLTDLPGGCPFHPRCPFVAQRCREFRPTLADGDAGPPDLAACWRADDPEVIKQLTAVTNGHG